MFLSPEEAKYRKYEVGDEENPTIADLAQQSDNFISSKQYAKKYGLELRRLPPACRKGALVADKRMVPDPYKNNALRPRWFILDIPPQEHPNWNQYQVNVSKYLSKGGDKAFKKKAPLYLEVFNKARLETERATFTQKELAGIFHSKVEMIRRWTDIGIEGFGKLPKMQFPEDKRPQYAGRIDIYYHQKDIIRFLKGELADPTKKFRTIDDAIVETEIDDIAASHGYYVYEPSKVASLDYEGFIKWAEDNVRIYNRRLRKSVPFRANAKQRELYKNVFKLDKDGTLKYRYICLSRPRGEYKTFDACLLILYRFFNLPEEMIFLVANSEKQTTHLLFNEAVKIIRRSPNLLDISGLDIQVKGIFLMAGKKEVYNSIEVISVESGTRSNATCFGFSEIYKLSNEIAYAEIDGSIRSVVNAWLIIESTVAPRGHIFQRLHDAYINGKDPLLYFQHYEDEYLNPETTKDQLEHFRTIFLPTDYNRFFRNRWEDAATGLFDEKKILEMGVIGIDNKVGPSPELTEAIIRLTDLQKNLNNLDGVVDTTDIKKQMMLIKSRFKYVDSIYKLPADSNDLDRLRELFECDFIIGMGLDRAKQIAKGHDRTALTTIAKGIIGENLWFAFILDIFMPAYPTLENITDRIIYNSQKYGWIDGIDVEEYQGKDIYDWCINKGYSANLVSASYRHQEEMFTLLYALSDGGYFKYPTVPIWLDKEDKVYHAMPPDGITDILSAELSVFEHQTQTEGRKAGYFGSAYKRSGRTKMGESKDDVVFSLAHAVYAANRGDLPALISNTAFAVALINNDVLGDYR